MSTEIQTIQQEVNAFAKTIPATIKTNQEMIASSSLFVAIRKKRKEAEKWFEDKFIGPTKALLKSHQNEAKLTIQPLVDAETMLTKALTEYRREEAERARKEQEKINKAYEKKVEKAVAKGKDVEDVAPPVVVQAPEKSTKTDDGQLIFRKVAKLDVFDEKLIPDAFMIITKKPNTTAILACLKSGMQEIPGCRIRWEEELATR